MSIKWNFLFIYLQHCIYSLKWFNSTDLPIPLDSPIGTNQQRNRIYLFPIALDEIYEFDGTNYVQKNTSYNNLYQGMVPFSTSINNIVYIQYYIDNQGSPLMTLLRFNISSLQWLSRTSFPTMDSNYWLGCYTSNETHLLTIGGSGDYYPAPSGYQQLWILDVVNNEWHSATRYPLFFSQVSCAYYRNIVYAFGGNRFGPYDHHNRFSNSILKYDLTTEKWSLAKAKLSCNKSQTTAIMPNNDGIIYIIGGTKYDPFPNRTTLTDVDLYFADDDVIEKATPLLQPRFLAMLGYINGHLHVFGGVFNHGRYNQHLLSSTEVSDIIGPTVTPTYAPTTPKPTHTPTSHRKSKSTVSAMNIILIASISGSLLCCAFLFCIVFYLRKRRQQNDDENLIQNGEGMQGVVDTLH